MTTPYFVQQRSGTIAQLNHVYGFSPTLVIAVGDAGTILRWDGQSWTRIVSSTSSNLNKVWGPDAAHLWIAGSQGTLLQSSDGGLTWVANAALTAAVGSLGNYVAIWGSSQFDVWVIEQTAGGFWHSSTGGDLGSWEHVTNIRATWQHMWGTSASVFACGFTGASGAQAGVFAQHDSSPGWTSRVSPTGVIAGLGCWPYPSGPQRWSVGYGSTGGVVVDASSFKPGSVQVFDVPYADVYHYNGVYGVDPSKLYAVGTDRSLNSSLSQLLVPVGSPTAASTWTNQALPATLPQGKGGLQSVFVDTSGYVAAVGAYGTIVALPASTMTLESAFANSTKTVRVTLTQIPLSQSSIGVGDALNPQSWFIQRLDNGVRLTTIAVSQVDRLTYDIVIAERLGSSLVQHEISATALVDAFGIAIQDPTTLDFSGVVAASAEDQDAITAANRYVVTDLANPPFPPSGSNIGGGTRVITASGDFASDSGNVLLKKLIMRRLTTTPGGFFHLPGYGLGLQVKEPLRTSDMVALKKNVQDQVLLEPEVDSVVVQLSLLPALGVLQIQLSVTTRTGQTFPVDASVKTAAVQL